MRRALVQLSIHVLETNPSVVVIRTDFKLESFECRFLKTPEKSSQKPSLKSSSLNYWLLHTKKVAIQLIIEHCVEVQV